MDRKHHEIRALSRLFDAGDDRALVALVHFPDGARGIGGAKKLIADPNVTTSAAPAAVVSSDLAQHCELLRGYQPDLLHMQYADTGTGMGHLSAAILRRSGD